MKTLYTDDCDVGQFVILSREGINERLQAGGDHVYPDYGAAEHAAKLLSRDRPGRLVYIAQISGQLLAVAEVYEVKRKP